MGFPQMLISNSLRFSLKFPKFHKIPQILHKAVYYFHLAFSTFNGLFQLAEGLCVCYITYLLHSNSVTLEK